ncbi:MAG: hypothetical protein K0S65_4951, partial [Labilithrix sp.]|nr:hypothetical protein [Labilithrix sp.]
MKIVLGIRFYGRINGERGVYRVTRFFHCCYLPLFPLGTFEGRREGGDLERAPFSVLSTLLAYFQVQGFFAALLLAFYAQKQVRSYGNAGGL